MRTWLAAAAAEKPDASAARLAGVLRDPKGLAFTVGFVDGVVRPEDLRAAAKRLAAIAPDVPGFLPLPLKLAVRLGGLFAPVLPGIVVPAARTALRGMVSHLIIDATPKRLGPAISRIRDRGVRLNLNLLGEAVLGSSEADRRLAGTRALVQRPDVDYVSIKVSAAVTRTARGRSTQPSPTSWSASARSTARRSRSAPSSTSTWRSTRTSTSRSRSSSSCSTSPSSSATPPASCCRRTCPTRSAR